MPELVAIVLTSWVAVCVFLFWKLPGRDAAVIAIVGGWAALPIGRYPASVFEWPIGNGGSAHALVVPAGILINKVTAIGLGCLAGSMLFGWAGLRRVRPSWADLPVVAWCLVPVASALSNGLSLVEGLDQSRYLALAWGVPYLMGRAYLADGEGLRRLGLGFVVAGTVYAPLCLAEFLWRPFLYGAVYGPHPYQLEGSARWLGFRPLVFQEHGNQLGIWMASAAVAAVWLWRSGRLTVPAGVRGGAVAAGLVTVCLLCQSHTAVVLMAAALVPLWFLGRGASAGGSGPKAFRSTTAVAGCVFLVAAAAVAVKAAADPRAREWVRGTFASAGKTSFTWRLARSEESLRLVAERPVLGWGQADWSDRPDRKFLNPVNLGLWLLASGMYGAVGIVAWTSLLLLPEISTFRRLPPWLWLSPSTSGVALAAVLLLMNLIDSLLNSTWVVPLTAAAGGLNGWSLRKGRETAGD